MDGTQEVVGMVALGAQPACMLACQNAGPRRCFAGSLCSLTRRLSPVPSSRASVTYCRRHGRLKACYAWHGSVACSASMAATHMHRHERGLSPSRRQRRTITFAASSLGSSSAPSTGQRFMSLRHGDAAPRNLQATRGASSASADGAPGKTCQTQPQARCKEARAWRTLPQHGMPSPPLPAHLHPPCRHRLSPPAREQQPAESTSGRARKERGWPQQRGSTRRHQSSAAALHARRRMLPRLLPHAGCYMQPMQPHP